MIVPCLFDFVKSLSCLLFRTCHNYNFVYILSRYKGISRHHLLSHCYICDKYEGEKRGKAEKASMAQSGKVMSAWVPVGIMIAAIFFFALGGGLIGAVRPLSPPSPFPLPPFSFLLVLFSLKAKKKTNLLHLSGQIPLPAT